MTAEKNLQVTIIIPTLNEIEGMKWFMPQLKKEWYDEIIVVDGGSTDGTVEYCRENGYPVFIQSKKGYANAFDEAFLRSTKDIIVAVTPDGNSVPGFIPKLAQKIQDGYDMAVASRYFGSAKSYDDDLATRLGNRVFTSLINLLFNAHYTDTLVGFRALRREAIHKMHLYDQNKQCFLRKMFPGIEMNSPDPGSGIRAAKLKLKVAEIPADEPKRIGGKRKLSIIKGGFGVLIQILYEFIKKDKWM